MKINQAYVFENCNLAKLVLITDRICYMSQASVCPRGSAWRGVCMEEVCLKTYLGKPPSDI